jgi:hypothetical protein
MNFLTFDYLLESDYSQHLQTFMKFYVFIHEFFNSHFLIACIQCDVYIICQYCKASTYNSC